MKNKGSALGAKILFNVFGVLAVVTNFMAIISMKNESTITNVFFGGYEKKTSFSKDSIVFPTQYKSVAEVKAASMNVCNAAESEGVTLLKNERDSLPLAKGNKVSLFSASSTIPVLSGGGGAIINKYYEDKKCVGFQKGFKEAGLLMNESLDRFYTENSDRNIKPYGRKNSVGNQKVATIGEAPWSVIPNEAKKEKADAGIFLLSRIGTEGVDLKADYLKLDDNEKSVLKGMKEEKDAGTFSKIILLINSANQIDLDFVDEKEYGIDAVLWVGLPGTSGVHAICDILVGGVSPSGKLPDTWYTKNAYEPTTPNYGSFRYEKKNKYYSSTPSYVFYQEGMYSGYRYTETRYEDAILGRGNAGEFDYHSVVKYPFGYGLSYTKFAYSNFKQNYDKQKDEYTLSVDVTNKGNNAGKDVVAVYLQKPYSDYAKENNMEIPSVALTNFAKTKKLKPGEKETIEIKVEGREFASYDAYNAKTYYLDKGDYYFALGNGAHEAINNILAHKGKLKSSSPLDVGNPSLVNKVTMLEASKDRYSSVTRKGKTTQISNLFDYSDLKRLGDETNSSIQYFSRFDWMKTLPKMDADGTFFLPDKENANGIIKWSKKIEEQYSSDKGKAILKKDENGNDRIYKLDEVKNDGRNYPKYNQKNNINWQDMRQIPETGEFIPYNDPKWESCLDQLSFEQTAKMVYSGLRGTITVENPSNGFIYPGTYDPNGPNGIMQEGFGKYRNTQGTNGFANLYEDLDKSEYTVAYSCPSIVAATFNNALMEKVGESMGEEALWCGANGVYAFTVNLHRNSKHGRACESISEDAALSGYTAAYLSKGCNKKGLNVYTKHIALNEQETNRISHSSWINEQSLRELYLKPYDLAIRLGGARNVMTSFSRVGAVWSGHSHNLLTAWLREEAGLEGFAITDWYQEGYMSMTGSLLCGQDLPDGDWLAKDTLEFAKKDASAIAWAMREAAHRIMYSAVHGNRVNGLATNTKANVSVITPNWIIARNIFVVMMNAFAIAASIWLVASIITNTSKRKKNIN